MKIAMRADSSTDMGVGHLMRCLTLADALRARGGEIRFICRELPGNMADLARERGYPVLPLPHGPGVALDHLPPERRWLGSTPEIDAVQTRAVLDDGAGVDLLVVDGYALDAAWHRVLRPLARRILVIDDLADREYDCDYLLDQTHGREARAYAALAPPRCRLLMGPRHALLRPAFAAARPAALRRREEGAGVQRLLVAMGGTDPHNVSAMALEAVQSSGLDLTVEVVLGSRAPHLEAVRRLAACCPQRVRVAVDVADMAQRMAWADLAIGAPGATSWERCCLGLPSLLVTFAANQEAIAAGLAAAGAARALGRFPQLDAGTLARALEQACAAPGALREMARRAARLCDGEGAQRVVEAVWP